VSPQTAQQTVLAVVLVTGAVIAWDNIKRTGKASPGGKQLVAYTILAAGLAILTGVAPQLGGPLAILIGLGVIVSRVGVVKKA
jgi:hypothetical protein